MLNLAYNSYTPLEFMGLYLLFRNKFSSIWARRVFRISAPGYAAISILIVAFSGLTQRFLNEWVCLSNLVYTVWILLFIIQEYYEDTAYKINLQQPLFWYLSGLFFYAPCTLLIFSLWQYIKSNPGSLLTHLFIIHNIFNINMYLLFTMGFIMDIRKHTFNIG